MQKRGTCALINSVNSPLIRALSLQLSAYRRKADNIIVIGFGEVIQEKQMIGKVLDRVLVKYLAPELIQSNVYLNNVNVRLTVFFSHV
ncbi:hypothetical protein M3Y98_00905800 [Aphelenchoides besseyi]|nr:hypothetical protein M3Y98_00905800 [Aphelenchoides besseyi]